MTSRRCPLQRFYSLSCETYSGTSQISEATTQWHSFLFAVVRDVQRNLPQTQELLSRLAPSFYSLSCETYSGT